jgi:hypothetical protein
MIAWDESPECWHAASAAARRRTPARRWKHHPSFNLGHGVAPTTLSMFCWDHKVAPECSLRRRVAAAVAIEMLVIFFASWSAGFSWLRGGYEYVLLWGLVSFAIALRGPHRINGGKDQRTVIGYCPLLPLHEPDMLKKFCEHG